MRRLFLIAMGLLSSAPWARAAVTVAPVFEGNSGTQVLSIALVSPDASNFTVTGNYRTVDGTATAADNDYVPAQGSFFITPGQTVSEPILITINGDTRLEADEQFTLELSNIQGPLTEQGPYTFTIRNDDSVSVTAGSAQVTEGNSGTTPMTFAVTMSAAAGIPVQASYFTTPGTATAGADYQPAQGTVTFAPGVTSAAVVVNVVGDTAFEADETFTLSVALAGAAPSNGTGTIVNDDARPATGVVIVSGNNQTVRPGQPLPQPLVVQVVDETGAPVSGATVRWRAKTGEAQFNPSSSTTGADGRASTIVTPMSVGTLEILAEVGSLPAAVFTINSRTTFELRAEGPVAVPIARVLDEWCARNEEQIIGPTCRALAALPDGELTPTLERVAPQQSGAQSKVASEVAMAVTNGIAARLSAVRGGVQRVSLQQLAFNGIPIGAVMNALIPQEATDAGGSGEDDGYNGWSAFLSGNLGEGERIARDGQLGFDLETSGLMFGVDRMFGQSVFGVSLQLMNLDSDLSADTGSVDTGSLSLSLYGSRGGFFASGAPNAAFDGMHLDGSITLGRNSYESEHNVDIEGMAPSRATSENDANVFALSAGTGFEAHHGRTDFDFTLNGTWSQARIDDLTEEGSGPLILFVQGHDVESLTATAGLNVRAAFSMPFGTLLPSVRAEMIHEFKDGARLVTARFLRDSSGTSFTVPLDQPDTNYGKVGAGLQGVFPYGWSVSLEATQDVSRSDLHFRTLQFNVLKSF